MNNWISVKDRLPKLEQYVLAVDSFGEVDLLEFCMDEEDGHFYFIRSNKVEDVCVTHWQPLPEPPCEP